MSNGEVRASIKSGLRVNFCVAISTSGTSCVTGSDDDHIRCVRTILLYRCELGFTLHPLQMTYTILVASCRMWDLNTGHLLAMMDGHTNDVICLAISQDGTICVSGSDDGCARVWDLAGKLFLLLPHFQPFKC